MISLICGIQKVKCLETESRMWGDQGLSVGKLGAVIKADKFITVSCGDQMHSIVIIITSTVL